ncbi:ABC transporter permease subunit [Sinorhizobium meliloti]|nr:ABC transporter permease subunit [Sinorhizobium meliloti]MQV37386.1 ABC transporter permease subunit [Sinorhizobium meliloti]RVE77415.1 ABC transporter permease subunit [Sinorhizobium meliloti]RVG41308.1 ABC transporter permease subunit [Sinorhizobium meliloti]RVM08216.1 ABC transporter permease subunit [Sinorhizobium meliloti]
MRSSVDSLPMKIIADDRPNPSQKPPKRRKKLATDLESPIFSLPALAVIVVGVFVPMAVLIVYSLWPTVDQEVVREWTFTNYLRFFESKVYWGTLLRSLLFASLASALTVILTFPFAYFVALKVQPERRLIWVLIAVVPFFTSYLIRVFAWMTLLGDTGLLNQGLMYVGLIESPLWLLGLNSSGIVLTFVYLLFPLAFLTAFIALERTNPTILEAAADLGARPWQGLIYVTLPVARTGIMGGFVFSTITILGDYVTPQLIGGTDGYLYSNIIQRQFGSSVQWGFGSALALILLVIVFVLLLVLRQVTGGAAQVGTFSRQFNPSSSPVLKAYAIAFLAFLYTPIGLLLVLALNDNTSIGFPFNGVTLRWFAAILSDPLLLESLRNSLIVAFASVSISVVLGTVAAVQLARSYGQWRQASLAIISVPLFLPPMLLGLAIIIGLNALGIERGLWTIITGHTILWLPVVTLLVLIRLEGLDPNLELAAMDLGAPPVTALARVSVPQALPGIVAAALISFALSMDEFILTALVTGADSTLPLYIFGQLRFNVTPAVVALSVTLLLVSFALLVMGALLATRGKGGPPVPAPNAIQNVSQ